MLPQFLSSRLQSSGTSTVPKKKNPFSVKPLNITTKSTMDASYKRLIWIWDEVQWAGVDRELLAQDYIKTFLIPNATDKQLIVGNLKGSSRQMISSLLSLSVLLMKESVAYLKEKMTMWAKLVAECMRLILPVTSKLKVFMLRITWTIWRSIPLNPLGQTLSSETLLSLPSQVMYAREPMQTIAYGGTYDIRCSTKDGRFEIMSKHEYALLTRISQVLGLDGTHMLSCEEALMAYGRA